MKNYKNRYNPLDYEDDYAMERKGSIRDMYQQKKQKQQSAKERRQQIRELKEERDWS